MAPLRVGMVGCGVIADIYCRNAGRFADIKLAACADLVPEAAQKRADQYGLRPLAVEELLTADDIDVVLNLTVPAAHAEVSAGALQAGKHVYSEKPLATTVDDARRLVALAERSGVQLAAAPDTVLGAAGREARRLVDEGVIGTVSAGTAFVMSRGMEHWHPNPGFFFAPGGGPVWDIGPYYLTQLVMLLGPVRHVLSLAGTGLAERLVTAEGPMKGQRIVPTTPTTLLALLEFEQGARVMLGASWDVHRHGHHPIELYGTNASLRVPDPNFMGGVLEIGTRDSDWQAIPTAHLAFGQANWPVDEPRHANDRGLGLAELARAIREGRPARLGGRLPLHVTAVMAAILEASEAGTAVAVAEATERPPHLTEGEARALLAA